MISKQGVKGSNIQAVPLIIGKDTVYVHTNIVQAMDLNGNSIDNLWQYDEIQYTKDEYMELLNMQLTNVQLALTEIYERIDTVG